MKPICYRILKPGETILSGDEVRNTETGAAWFPSLFVGDEVPGGPTELEYRRPIYRYNRTSWAWARRLIAEAAAYKNLPPIPPDPERHPFHELAHRTPYSTYVIREAWEKSQPEIIRMGLSVAEYCSMLGGLIEQGMSLENAAEIIRRSAP